MTRAVYLAALLNAFVIGYLIRAGEWVLLPAPIAGMLLLVVASFFRPGWKAPKQ